MKRGARTGRDPASVPRVCPPVHARIRDGVLGRPARMYHASSLRLTCRWVDPARSTETPGGRRLDVVRNRRERIPAPEGTNSRTRRQGGGESLPPPPVPDWPVGL